MRWLKFTQRIDSVSWNKVKIIKVGEFTDYFIGQHLVNLLTFVIFILLEDIESTP